MFFSILLPQPSWIVGMSLEPSMFIGHSYIRITEKYLHSNADRKVETIKSLQLLHIPPTLLFMASVEKNIDNNWQ